MFTDEVLISALGRKQLTLIVLLLPVIQGSPVSAQDQVSGKWRGDCSGCGLSIWGLSGLQFRGSGSGQESLVGSLLMGLKGSHPLMTLLEYPITGLQTVALKWDRIKSSICG